MKKLLSLLLVLAMVFTLAACGGKKEKDEGIAGKYVLTSVEFDGEEMSEEDMESEFGDDCYIDIDEDGTAVMKVDGEKMDMEWEDDEIWEADDEDNKFELEINEKKGTVKITTEEDGEEMTLTFEKEKEKKSSKKETTSKKNSIEGKYKFVSMTDGDETYDLDRITDEMGEEAAETLGAMYIKITGDGTAEMYNGDETKDLEFEDGEIWPVDDPDDIIEYEIDGDQFILFTEDGEMVFEK